MIRRCLHIFDRFWWRAACLHAGLTVWLNYLAQYEHGHIPYYKDVARVIAAGFDPAAAVHHVPTFPMWGYAFFFVATQSRTVILIVQELLAVAATWLVVRQVERDQYFAANTVRLFKAAAVASTPWWAFHANIWAAAPAASLGLLALFSLLPALQARPSPLRWLVASAALFGLALNFRSDYHLLAVGLWLILLFSYRFRLFIVGRMLVWCAVAYALLIPWLLYTKHVTGHCLLSSTNGGATLFTGLGTLPNNRWGIQLQDHDPLLHTLLADRFVGRNSPLYKTPKEYTWPDQWTAFPGAMSSVDWRADQFLKAEFRRRVTEYPGEFVRKCARAFYLSIISAGYTGEIYRHVPFEYDATGETDAFATARKDLLRSPFRFVARRGWDAAYVLIQIYASVANRVTIVLSFIALPLVIASALRRRNLLLVLMLTAILFQLAMTTLVMQQARFTSNVYLLHVLNVCCAVQLCARVNRRQPKPMG